MSSTVRILGLDFFQGSVAEAVQAANAGGLIIAPSGPGLATLAEDGVYRAALLAADVRLLDSGLLATLWEVRHRRRLSRISGYRFLCEFLKNPAISAPGASLWVAPAPGSSLRTRDWLSHTLGLSTPDAAWYVAPQYNPNAVHDSKLLALIRERRPRFIFISVGGGPQEKLGAWLKARLDFRPAILCTGAAIAFLTGEQARIPDWADRARLGWLLRCLQDPRRFAPRYWQARKLISLYRQTGENLPAATP